MIGIFLRTEWHTGTLRSKTAEGAFKGLSHAAAAIRMTARRSIKRAPRDLTRNDRGQFQSDGETHQSSPGSPPHTRAGALKRSILYAVDKQRQVAVIGPAASMMGPSAAAHEHGGRFRGRRYPKRPFMGPALMQNLNRMQHFWRGAIR